MICMHIELIFKEAQSGKHFEICTV